MNVTRFTINLDLPQERRYDHVFAYVPDAAYSDQFNQVDSYNQSLPFFVKHFLHARHKILL